jgi:hypothetical protein
MDSLRLAPFLLCCSLIQAAPVDWNAAARQAAPRKQPLRFWTNCASGPGARALRP